MCVKAHLSAKRIWIFMYRFFKRRCLWASINVTVFLTGSLVAGDLALSQEAAVTRALATNPWLHAAELSIAQAEVGITRAGRLDNPTLNLSYATDRAFNDEGEQSYAVGFEQAFPVTRRLRLEKEVAQIELELARAEVVDYRRLLTHEVETVYLNVAELQAQVALRDELLGLYATFADFVDSRIATGEASAIEVNQIKIERYAIEQERLRLMNDLRLNASSLSELLALPVDQAVEVTIDSVLPNRMAEMPTFDKAMLEQHPAYRMRQLMRRIADSEIGLAKANRWADVAVEVFYEEERGVDAPEGLGRDRFFGVGLSIPLPLMNDGRASVKESRIVSDRRAKELHAAAARIQGEVRLRVAQVEQFYTQAEAYEDGVQPLVLENLDTMKQAYADGQIPLTELFRSQAQGFRVRSAHLEWLYDYAQAVVDWESAAAQQKGVSP
jgi:cobalt-zinc-cadmium efflux system outer membrane protein